VESLVDLLNDLFLSDLTMSLAEILVPVIVTGLLGLLFRVLAMVSAYIKAHATEAQILVLQELADIVVSAVEQYWKTNELPVLWTEEPDQEQVKTIRKAKLDRAISEFEALRQLHKVPAVGGVDMRAYIEQAVNAQHLGSEGA